MREGNKKKGKRKEEDKLIADKIDILQVQWLEKQNK